MSSFFVELWESIFTPGTSPALIKATHGSFVLLLLSLAFLIFYTRSIHFINLFVIALCLWGAVIWFIQELKNAKLKDNEELVDETADNKDASADKASAGKTSGSTIKRPATPKKRKV